MKTIGRRSAPPQAPEYKTMNRTLATSALLGSLLLAACASAPVPPPALVEARSTVRGAELDTAVQANAPLELKKATDSLVRANNLLAKRESDAEVSSAAYVASQQARTAIAIAQAKSNDAAIGAADADRQRARADVRSADAERAQAQAVAARRQTADAERRAASAEQQSAVAQADAAGAQQQAAQLQQRLDELQALQTERGMLVTLGDVLFEFNRAEVKPAARTSLRKLADFLQQYPARQVLIEGFTDNSGSAAYNEALSRRRAESVDNALIGMGVASQRVATIGYGEEYPIADNSTDTNRALNRRVEVYIAENDQPVRSRC